MLGPSKIFADNVQLMPDGNPGTANYINHRAHMVHRASSRMEGALVLHVEHSQRYQITGCDTEREMPGGGSTGDAECMYSPCLHTSRGSASCSNCGSRIVAAGTELSLTPDKTYDTLAHRRMQCPASGPASHTYLTTESRTALTARSHAPYKSPRVVHRRYGSHFATPLVISSLLMRGASENVSLAAHKSHGGVVCRQGGARLTTVSLLALEVRANQRASETRV